jgi:putative AdoMet-dependent methyltransferase
MGKPMWQLDETIPRGDNFSSLENVLSYVRDMAAIRDWEAEAAEILSFLALTADDVLLEVGSGTGAFARAAAHRCRAVIALDVSEAMLTYASGEARRQGIDNITFQRAGFLTYEHEGEPVAAVVSQLALHHLPDAWKAVALRRMSNLMRPQGRLYLSDLVLSEDMASDPGLYMRRLLSGLPEAHHEPIMRHVADEFSTFDWTMRELLERAGFIIDESRARDIMTEYLCHKP